MSASVFPARAGMSRCAHMVFTSEDCVPRASGDEPSLTWNPTKEDPCSPRERG